MDDEAVDIEALEAAAGFDLAESSHVSHDIPAEEICRQLQLLKRKPAAYVMDNADTALLADAAAMLERERARFGARLTLKPLGSHVTARVLATSSLTDDRDDDPLLRVYSSSPCATLIVAFTGMGGGGSGGGLRHQLVGACRHAGAEHALFVKDPYQSWFLCGLGGSEGGSEGGFDAVIGAVEAEARRLRPRRLVTIGLSMGGYAAIRAGLALAADAVVAFSPQIVIDPEQRKANAKLAAT